MTAEKELVFSKDEVRHKLFNSKWSAQSAYTHEHYYIYIYLKSAWIYVGLGEDIGSNFWFIECSLQRTVFNNIYVLFKLLLIYLIKHLTYESDRNETYILK